jgi:hypothetical protein
VAGAAVQGVQDPVDRSTVGVRERRSATVTSSAGSSASTSTVDLPVHDPAAGEQVGGERDVGCRAAVAFAHPRRRRPADPDGDDVVPAVQDEHARPGIDVPAAGLHGPRQLGTDVDPHPAAGTADPTHEHRSIDVDDVGDLHLADRADPEAVVTTTSASASACWSWCSEGRRAR